MNIFGNDVNVLTIIIFGLLCMGAGAYIVMALLMSTPEDRK